MRNNTPKKEAEKRQRSVKRRPNRKSNEDDPNDKKEKPVTKDEITNQIQFEIDSKKPEKLLINGLSMFLSQNIKFDVKVVNKDIVLFKAFDKEKNYSESGIINRKSGELVHEVTKDLKSENFEKDISFYKCS